MIAAGRAPRLADRVALVTGAARGLGRACALAMAGEGADLLLVDIAADIPEVPYPLGSASQLHHTAGCCRDLGVAALVAVADVRRLDALVDAVDLGLRRFGRIDVVVSCAGIVTPAGAPVHEIAEADWQLMIDVDLSGAWRTIRAVGGLMARQRSGSIVNVASTAGLVGYRNFAGYVGAKHGLIGLTRAAALDLGQYGVRVNALCPGSVRDAPELEGVMLREIGRCLGIPPAEHEEAFREGQPMHALVEPADVAAACVYLASDESRQVTGSVLTVDGGFTVR